VVHIDVERRWGPLWASASRSTGGAGHQPIKEFKKQTGLDAFKDIKGVTVYGLSSRRTRHRGGDGDSELEDALNQMVSRRSRFKKLEEGEDDLPVA